MAELDRLLAALVGNRADALVLDDDAVVRLELGGTQKPLTRTPLSGPQIARLLKEAADPPVRAQLDAGTPTTFKRVTDDGTFVIAATPSGGRWSVSIRVDPTAPRPTKPPPRNMAGTPSASAVPVPGPRLSRPIGPVTAENGGLVAASLDEVRGFEGSGQARAALDILLRKMVEVGASDLHLRVGEPPILRHHGEMTRLSGQPPLDNDTLAAMVRSIMPERNRLEYLETNDADFAYEISGVARFRANAARDRNGALAVFRQIPATVVTVEQMGISEEVQRLCFLTKGLVLVTGPTGSGKSTTLCALIDLVNRARSDHVLTIEDPIEFVHANKRCVITQRQVGVHTKSFKSALRAALREDPDIILVGEMRDLETVSIAIETAETGHLVFGTLHTTTAAGTVDRIIDQFPSDRQEQIRVMLAESLKGVISQTLCKKVGGGRVAAREILLSMPSITNLIREGKTFQIPSVIQTSKRLGMIPLNDALIAHVDAGVVEPREAYMKAVDKSGFVLMLKNRGVDVGFAETDAAPAKSEGSGSAGAPRPSAAIKK
jgi:twitching motility protein PilT